MANLLESFTETTATLAQAAGCTPETLRRYADAGLVEFFRLPNRQRLFKRSSVTLVRQLCVDGLARRGRWPRRKAAGI